MPISYLNLSAMQPQYESIVLPFDLYLSARHFEIVSAKNLEDIMECQKSF